MILKWMKSIQGGSWTYLPADNELQESIINKLESFGAGSVNMALAVVDGSGQPTMKAVNIKCRDGLNKLWFVTHRSSAHGSILLSDVCCSLMAYSDATWEGLLLKGRAVIEEDRLIKEDCWRDFYKDAFPRRIDDPEYLCFRFETGSVEYTDCSGPVVCFAME
jgi:general stress protein 26